MMTAQTTFENIQSVFPDVGETQILKDMDRAQKLIANETGLLTATGSLSSISTTVGWTLPSDFVSLTGQDPVRFYDSDGNPKYLGDYNYAYEIQFGKFYIYSLTETEITGLNTEIDSAYIHYTKRSTAISARSTTLEIEDEFVDAIEHYVLKNYFAKYPVDTVAQGQIIKARDWNAVRFHTGEYEKLRIRAKRHANIKLEDREAEVQNYQWAGRYQLPRRTKDSTIGSSTITQISELSNSYAKYALYLVTGVEGTIAETLQVAYSTISASVLGTTFTVTSTADFGDDTTIICNNANVSWVHNSSSQITFTLPGSYTVIAIEIYERT